MNTQKRTRILLSIMPTPKKIVRKRTNHGELFECLAHHFNGSGLLEVTYQIAKTQRRTTFRFSKYGELIGAFTRSATEDDLLLYDHDSGFLHEEGIEELAVLLLQKLALTITPEEDLNYYL